MVTKHIAKIPSRREDTHKGDFGYVFVVGGSRGMTGAAYLASQAALLAGSGIVTCGIPKSLNDIMECKFTEVMTLPLAETKEGSFALSAEKAIVNFAAGSSVLVLGPGLSRNNETARLARKIVKRVEIPIVLDADGIIALAMKSDILKKRKKSIILTPHPGEMSRLTEKSVSSIQANREKTASDFAKKNDVVLVLKGYRTVVADGEGNLYVNKTGNSGMSTAGVGDVLTGMIASFLGQGICPYSAAVIGVYLHGLAGDIAARDKGQFSLIATDLLDKLPQAMRETL